MKKIINFNIFFLTATILISVLMFTSFNFSNSKVENNISLENIIESSKANIIKSESLGYTSFSSNVSMEENLNSIISKNFNNKKFTLSNIEDSIIAEHKSHDEYINITISQSKNLQTISIFYSHNVYDKNIINLRDVILQILLDFDNSPNVSSQLVGKIDSKLSILEMDTLGSAILSNFTNNFKKDYLENNCLSYSGYSKHLSSPVNVNGKPINIQLSLRYSSSDNSTYIIVGTPIISGEY